MTVIGYLPDKDFEADFPLDYGKGVRGEWVKHRKKIAGIILCHRMAGDIGCAVSVFWVKVNSQQIFTKESDVPLTIQEDIRCSCGLHGWIRDGRWVNAHDSLF